MEKRIFTLSLLGILLLFSVVVSYHNIEYKAWLEQKTADSIYAASSVIYPEPFRITLSKSERKARSELPLEQQVELDWEDYAQYLYKYEDMYWKDGKKVSLREPKIVFDSNPMSKLRGYRYYNQAIKDGETYPFNYTLYAGMKIHGMTKDEVIAKYRYKPLYERTDTLRYGVSVSREHMHRKVCYMTSLLHYAEVTRCIWTSIVHELPIDRVVFFIRDGDVQRAFWGIQIEQGKMWDSPLMP